MTRQATTPLQVSGYRFVLRRLEHALVRGDARMADDPLRAQSISLLVGAVLTVVAVGICAVTAVVRPHGAVGDAPVVLVRDTAALYVRIGESLHPVLNLTSAWLIAGGRAAPRAVAQSAVDAAPRGPLVGIAGAPARIDPPLGAPAAGWAVCEDGEATATAIAGAPAPADTGGSVLVTPAGESAATTYLVHAGHKAAVDLRSAAVVRALRLDGVTPRPVSRALLDAIPDAPPIAAPAVPRAGAPGPGALHGIAVGTVVRVARAGPSEYYVVLADGVQRVGEVAADLIRFTQNVNGPEIPVVTADVAGSAPTARPLPVGLFPNRAGVTDGPVLCAHWRPDANSVVAVGDSLPVTVAPIRLAQADGPGAYVDAVVMPAGRSAYVRAVGLAGDGAGGPVYYVSDLGVVFGVRDGQAAERLGLTGAPAPAPWPLIARLPRGPELSVEGASVVRDAVAGPP